MPVLRRHGRRFIFCWRFCLHFRTKTRAEGYKNSECPTRWRGTWVVSENIDGFEAWLLTFLRHESSSSSSRLLRLKGGYPLQFRKTSQNNSLGFGEQFGRLPRGKLLEISKQYKLQSNAKISPLLFPLRKVHFSWPRIKKSITHNACQNKKAGE